MAADKRITIAIDGFSSCGKSTLARQLARKLGYLYIDSGAMYRAITLYFLRNNVDFDNPQEVEQALQNIDIVFLPLPDPEDRVLLNQEDVSSRIREMLVAEKVSEVAALKPVRTFAVDQQRKMSTDGGIVMDGRDIGTVVFPDAELKIFMTAEPAVRVIRRLHELEAQEPGISLEEVQRNLEMRDYIDANRKESPLRKADDARVLDNSNLDRAEQLQTVLNWVYELTQKPQTSNTTA